MIGWSTINPVLIGVFTEAAIDRAQLSEGYSAEWREGPLKFISPHQRQALLLKVTRVSAIGEDETRSELVGDDVIETQSGQRRFVLQVQAVVPERTDSQWAMVTLERVRMRLRRPRVLNQLLDLDVSLIRIDDAIKASFKDGGRVLSAANMDIVFGAVASEDDPIPAGWVQYLVISSQVKDGTELQPTLQLVNAEVPTIPDAP